MRQLTGANESTEDEDENEKLALEVSRTLRMLKEAETSCDSAMVQIRQMNADVTGMGYLNLTFPDKILPVASYAIPYRAYKTTLCLYFTPVSET